MFIKDEIHGEFDLPEYVSEFINSSSFQRMKKLKQLGVSNYIYSNAVHSRYAHSIGTAYLCQKILNIIESNSDIKINGILKKCVILAGLLHDIGHGSFSHMWEFCVQNTYDREWTHEKQSLIMINHMIESNNIMLHEDLNIHNYMLDLICSLIIGDCEKWSRLLKRSEIFLTEIVSNKHCHIDVDKCDYLLRDHYHVEYPIEPFIDFINSARVVYDDQQISHIGYNVSDFHLIENMFINRARYHMNVYQLNKVAGIEKQLKDIFMKADKAGYKFLGYSVPEIQRHCHLYDQLDDNILNHIRAEETIDNSEMRDAQKLISSLDNGNFYESIFETKDDNEATYMYELLVKKFGQIFCKVKKHIPNAEVPQNIPLYDDDYNIVVKKSNHKLSYDSTIIFCTCFNEIIIHNILNYLNNNDD